MNEELSNQTDNTQDQSDYFQNVDTLGNAVSLSDIPSTQPNISSNVEVPQKFNILTGEPERSLSDTFPIPKEGEPILNTTEKTIPSVLDTSAEDSVDNKKPTTDVDTPDTSVDNKKKPEEIKNPYDASDQLGWDPGSGVPVMSSSGLSKEPSRPLFYGAVSKAIIQGTPIGDIKPEDESVFERNMAAIAGSVLKQTPQVVTTAGRIWDWLHTNDIPVEETGVYKLNKLMENSEWFQKYIVNASKVATHLGEDSIAEEFVAPFMGWMVAAGIITPLVVAAAPEEILVGLGALGLSLYRAARAGRMVSLAETTAKASEIASNLNKLTGVGKFLAVTAPTFLTRLAVATPAAGVILMGSDEVENYVDPIFGESVIDKQQRKLGSDDLQRQWINSMKYYATTALYAVAIETAAKPLINFYGKAIRAVGQEAKEFIGGGFKKTGETGVTKGDFPKLITNEDLKTGQPIVEVVKQGQDLVKNDTLLEDWIGRTNFELKPKNWIDIKSQRILRGETGFEPQPNNWKELYYDQGASFWVDKEGNVRTFVDESGKNLPSQGRVVEGKVSGEMEVPQSSLGLYSFPGQLENLIPLVKQGLIKIADSSGKLLDKAESMKYLFTSEGKVSKPIYKAVELSQGEKNVVSGNAILLKRNLDNKIKQIFKDNKLIQQTPEEVSQKLNDFLWSTKDVVDKKTGNINFNSFDNKTLNKIQKYFKDLNVSQDTVNELIGNLKDVRVAANDIKNELIPKNKSLKEKVKAAKELNNILNKRTGPYLKSDWNISKDGKLIPVSNNETVGDLSGKIRNIIKNNAEKSGVTLTDKDLDIMMNDLTKASLDKTTNSPEFKITPFQEALKQNSTKASKTIKLANSFKDNEFVPNIIINTEKDLKVFEQFFGIKRATAQKALTNVLSDLGSFVYNNKMYNDMWQLHLDNLKTSGEGFFYDNATEARRALGGEVEDLKQLNLKSPLNDEIYQTPLNGKWTSRSNAEALEFIQKFPFDRMLQNVFYKNVYAPLLATSSVSKVALNPIRWLVDAQQYASMLVLKSIRSPKSLYNGMQWAVKALRGKYGNSIDSDARLFWNDMVRNKIVSSTMSFNTFEDLIQVRKGGYSFLDKVINGDITPELITNPFTKTVRWVFQNVKQGYVTLDDVFKIISVAQEHYQLIEDYSKAIKNKTFDPTYGKVHTEFTPELINDLLNRAYEITKATMPNFSRMSIAGKALVRNPLISPFVSFDLEIIRNFGGIQATAIKEIANPITKTSGKIRMLGSYVTYASLGGAGLYAYDWATGISDEQHLAGMRAVPKRLQSNQVSIGYDKNLKEPWYWQNVSHINATNILTSIPYALQLSIRKQKQYYPERGIINQVTHAIGEAAHSIYETSPFFEKKLMIQVIDDFKNMKDGITPQGKIIYLPSDPLIDKIGKMALYAAETIEQPGGVGQETKIYKAIFNIPGEHGEKYDLTNELGRGVLGVPRQPIDRYVVMDKSASNYSGEINRIHKESKEIFGTVDKPNINLTKEEIVTAVYRLQLQKYKAWNEFYLDYKAMKTLGLKDNKLYEKGTIPENLLDEITTKQFSPMSFEKTLEDYATWSDEAKRKFGQSDYFIPPKGYNVIDKMIRDMDGIKPGLDLEKKFPLERYLPKPINTPGPTTPGIVSTLPTHIQEQINLKNSPMPNQSSLNNPANQQVASNNANPLHNGLTISENALLSPSEQQIRLRERGLA